MDSDTKGARGPGAELYWQLRPADAPLPDEDRMEMMLLRQSQFRDRADEMAEAGSEWTAVALWDLDRTAETLENDEECERIAALFVAQPEVLDAFVAPYKERNRLWISALIHCEFGPELRAMNAGEKIAERLKDELPWTTVELEPWERTFLYMPRVDLPSAGGRRRFRELREQRAA